jgi:ATP adenylyltransferase
MDYILGEKPPGCPFCFEGDLAATADSLVLAVRRTCFAMLNRFPYTGCHLMVLPRRHVSGLNMLEADEYQEMMTLVRDSLEALTGQVNPDGVNLGMNLGSAAGAGIESHLHMHLVPRWRGDTNFMPVTAGARVVSQGLEHAWASLRPAFEHLDEL